MHIDRDEWLWLRSLSRYDPPVEPTPSQLAFHWSLQSAARVLLNDLDITEESAREHRLYTAEVLLQKNMPKAMYAHR